MFWKKSWKYHLTGTEQNSVLFGVNIFDYEWTDTKEKITVTDPLYKQTHTFTVYTVIINGRSHSFAAGEFSNGQWGFYLKK